VTAIDVVNKALRLAKERELAAPSFEIYSSVVAQLEYMARVLSGDETNRDLMKKIIIGHYAVREFEESDPELAEALMAAQSIASKMAKGLKI